MKASLATSLAVISAAATVLAAPSSHAGVGRRQNDCPPVHVFGARETTAPPGFGTSQAVVDSIVEANEGATSEAIIYPAAGDSEYASSVTAGIQAVVNQTMSFRLACPMTRMVLVGYSQGAQIMDDAVCGGPDGSSLNTTFSMIPRGVGMSIVAVVLMGNPRHVDGLPYNVGDAVEGGFAARPAGFRCPGYEARLQSYCDGADPFCSKGNDPAAHQAYAQKYGSQVLDFVQKQLAGSAKGVSGAQVEGDQKPDELKSDARPSGPSGWLTQLGWAGAVTSILISTL